jgi:hypothetical protein
MPSRLRDPIGTKVATEIASARLTVTASKYIVGVCAYIRGFFYG